MAKLRIRSSVRIVWEPSGADAVSFQVSPISAVSGLLFAERQTSLGPPKDSDGVDRLRSMIELAVAHVDAWEGLEVEDGVPAPCDEPTKRAFFSQQPAALASVVEAICAPVNSEAGRKNASGDGCEPASPIPQSHAGSSTTTATSVLATAAAGGVDATGSPV